MTADIRASEASLRAKPLSEAFGRALRRYAIFIILAALIVFFDFAEPAFLRVDNLFSVLQSVAVVALLGVTLRGIVAALKTPHDVFLMPFAACARAVLRGNRLSNYGAEQRSKLRRLV